MQYVVTGGCYASTNQNLAKCAFESTDCEVGTFFQSSRQMLARGDVPCDARNMPVGRCTSSIDEIDCANTNAACSINTKFEATDATCKIGHDSAVPDGEPTLFGACAPNPQSTEETDDYHCAWSKADCTPGKDSWVNGALTAWTGGCDCTRVKTGACKSPSGEYKCAVSEQGCDSESTFISMRDLSIESDHPDANCRLCAPRNFTMGQHFVSPGGCYNSSYVRQSCALQASRCASGQIFLSSLQISDLGYATCDVNAIVVGRCTSSIDRADCTNRAESCQISLKFQENDGTCTIKQDSVNAQPTLFGSCLKHGVKKSYLCAWSTDSCEGGAVGHWLPAVYNDYWGQGCSCDLVHTGACRTPTGKYYCGVAEDACDSESEYLSPRQLLGNHAIDCRLCIGDGNSLTTIGANLLIPQAPTPAPTNSAAPAPVPLSCPNVPITGCSVCGTGKCITKPDVVFSFPGQSSVPCGSLEQAGHDGLVPLNDCPFLPDLVKDVCGCQVATSAPTPPPTPHPPTPMPVPTTCPNVPATGCSVCGTGKCITKPDVVFSFPGQSSVPCGSLEQAGHDGLVPLNDCPFLPDLVKDVCGCQVATSYSGAAPTPHPTPHPPTPVPAPTTCPNVPATGCSVCGTGKCITKPDVVFSFPGQPRVPCGSLEQAGHDGLVPLNDCPFLPDLVKDVCGCQVATSYSDAAPNAAPTSRPFNAASSRGGLSTGAIIGISIGAIMVGLSILGLAVLVTARSRSSSKRSPPPSTRDAATAGSPIDADGSTSMRNVEMLGEELY